MTLESFLQPAGVFGFVALIIMGTVWFGLTIGILCIMEVSVSLCRSYWIMTTHRRAFRRFCMLCVCTGLKLMANTTKLGVT